jgi:hypothetical protein
MPELKSSSRVALKATYVLKAPVGAAATGGRAKEPTPFEKANFIRALRITPDEANRLTQTFRGDDHDTAYRLAPLLESSAPEIQALHTPRYADIPVERLVSFAKAVDVARRSTEKHGSLEATVTSGPIRSGADTAFGLSPWTAQGVPFGGRSFRDELKFFSEPALPSFPYIPIEALIAHLKEQAELEPVGWLHLERLEMKPVGIERGELVSTIPMAPGESVRVGHKEWSIYSEELSRIVTDELENYAERGVEEKHDVAMSTDSENRRDTRGPRKIPLAKSARI